MKKGNLYYGPLSRPRPYADITEKDPLVVSFDVEYRYKKLGWRQSAWRIDDTSLEPAMDWWSEQNAQDKGKRTHV